MSNFYEDASVVMVPSGYKTSKVYSSVPDDGSADLTFSRSNDTATRVGPDGFIEKVRTNVSLYSEDYTNAYWLKGDINLSANSIANPVNGEITATTITPNTNSASHYMRSSPFAMSANTEISQSIYAKANGYNYVMLEGYDGSNNPKIMFNLSDSSFSTISATGNPVGSVEALEDGWYRLKMTWTTQSGSPNVYQYYFVFETSSPASWAGNGTSGAYFFGAQLEYGVTTDYIATTSSAVSVGPLANIPRLDYSGGANSPSLLLEPQRTNLVTYSEQFDNAAWMKNASGTGVAPIVTANTTISPDGYQNADTIVFNSGAGTTGSDQSFINRAFGGQAAGTYTLSFYAKTNSGTGKILARHAGGFLYTTINLTDQWQRFEVTETLASSGTIYLDLGLRRGLPNEPLTSSVTCQIWGVQFEAGAYATSYIPTLSAAVTRGAESCSKTSATALIGQTEGTMFAEIDWDGRDKDSMFFTLSDGTTNNRMHIGYDESANRFYFNIRVANVQQALIVQNTPASGIKKIAAAYKANDVVLYINGVQIGSSTSTSVAATNQIDIGNYYSTGYQYPVKQNLLFPTRLSDADLSLLTTL